MKDISAKQGTVFQLSSHKYGFSEEWKTGRHWLFMSTKEDEHRHRTVMFVNCEFDADANFSYNVNTISYKLAKTICLTQ